MGLINLFVIIKNASDISNIEMLLGIIVITAFPLNTSNTIGAINITNNIDGVNDNQLLE